MNAKHEAMMVPKGHPAYELQRATLEARERCNDEAIGTCGDARGVQIVRVTYDAKGKSTVIPLTGFMPRSRAIATLDGFKPRSA